MRRTVGDLGAHHDAEERLELALVDGAAVVLVIGTESLHRLILLLLSEREVELKEATSGITGRKRQRDRKTNCRYRDVASALANDANALRWKPSDSARSILTLPPLTSGLSANHRVFAPRSTATMKSNDLQGINIT